jgi:hypothetical protein
MNGHDCREMNGDPDFFLAIQEAGSLGPLKQKKLKDNIAFDLPGKSRGKCPHSTRPERSIRENNL